MDRDAPLTPTTTSEQDRHSLGQRRVNIIWELTQAVMAVLVTGAVIYNSTKGIESEILGNAFVLIIALYFVRTNHVKVGGVGGSDSKEGR